MINTNKVIVNGNFFDQPVKKTRSAWKNIKKQWSNNIKFIRLFVSSNYYKLIGIDLSRQTNTSILQEIKFTGKSEEGDNATMFFIAEKQQKTVIKFSLYSLIVTE